MDYKKIDENTVERSRTVKETLSKEDLQDQIKSLQERKSEIETEILELETALKSLERE